MEASTGSIFDFPLNSQHGFINFNLAAQVKHGFAADSDAVSHLFAEKFSATP